MADGSFQLAQALGAARQVVSGGARLPLTAAQLARAAMTQQGSDLVIVQADGTTVQVRGYFATASHADLQTADGAVLSHQAIESGVRAAGAPDTSSTVPQDVADATGRIAPRASGGRGGTTGLRTLGGDSLSNLLGLSDDQALGGSGRDAGGSTPGLSPPGGGLDSLLGPAPSQRLPTEILANLAPGGSPTTPTTPTTIGTTLGTTTTTATTAPGPSITFSRGPIGAESGNPGSSSPGIPRQYQTGTAGDDSFSSPLFGVHHTTPLNAGSFQIDDGANGAQTINVVNNAVVFTYQGVTFELDNAVSQLSSTTAPNNTDWFQRPVDDTYAGLAGNDTVIGGAGQDKLLGDFDLPSGFTPLTSSSADAAPAGFTPGNDSVDGGDGADTLYGGGGQDTVRGGNDDDIVYVGDLNFALVDGGTGLTNNSFPGQSQIDPDDGNPYFTAKPVTVTAAFDELILIGKNLSVDLTNSAIANKITKFEAIDLGTNSGNSFKATAAQVFAEGSESPGASPGGVSVNQKALFILGGNASDHPELANQVTLTGGGWSLANSNIDGSTLEINTPSSIHFDQYTNANGGNTVSVYVETTIAMSQVALG